MQNRVAQCLRKMQVGLGVADARRILNAFGCRSALSGSTYRLTARRWNEELPASAKNLILLSGTTRPLILGKRLRRPNTPHAA